LDELATAEVDAAPAYPMTQITVTNTSADWGDVVENLLFRIEQSGGTIVCWGVTNKDATATLFYPDVKSDGDFGYATNEGISIAVGDTIRVYNNRHIWAMVSRVTSAGRQLKRWNQPYDGEGRTPEPVVIMGHDLQAWVDTGTNRATFAFDGSDSYDWIYGTSGITTYAWTLPSGAVVIGGGTSQDNVTFTIPAGIYRVQLTVTSQTGRTATGVRTIYANDRSSNKPFGDTYAIQSIGSDMVDINGWEGQFTVMGDVSSLAYPGMKCHFFVPVYYDGSRLTGNDAFVDVFIGYLAEIRISTGADGVQSTTLTFKSPLKICQLLPSATQFFEEVPLPNTWQQVRAGLSDPAYAGFYILKYHTTVVDNHDYIYEAVLRNLRRRVFGFPADNTNAHLTVIGLLMSGDVGCRADGTITLTQKPNLQDAADRNTRDDKFTWTEDSVRERLVISPRMRPDIAYLIMAGVSYAGNRRKPSPKFAAKAPGRAQAQGVTKTDLPDITLTTAGGAAELYGIIGHQFAYLNNPLAQVDVLPAKMFDVLEPADPDWHTLNISESDYLPVAMDRFGVRWASDMRFRPTRVSRLWSNDTGAWVKQITAQVRIESSGRPGVFHPVFRGQKISAINPQSGWIDNLDLTMPDINIDFSVDLPDIDDWGFDWGFNNFGLSALSENWTDDRPTYVSTNTGVTGDVLAQSLDYAETSPQEAFLIVQNGDTVTIYENSDIETDPDNWTSALAIDMSGQGFHGVVRLVSNSSLALLALTTETKMIVYRKASGGAWVGPTTVGDTATADTTGALSQFGVVLDGTKQWVPGRENTNDGYRIYKATTVGGAFSAVANTPGDNATSATQFPVLLRDGTNIIAVIGTLDATLAGETRRWEWTSALPDMVENNIVSIPDRDPPADTTLWTSDVDWWAKWTFNANGIPAQYGRAIIYYTDENAAGIDYTISNMEWTTETLQYYLVAETAVDMIIELRLLDKNKIVLWTTGEISYNTTSDAVILDTGAWGTGTRTLRSYQTTSTPASPVSGVRYVELLHRSANLETFDVIDTGPGGNVPEFTVYGVFRLSTRPIDDWTIDSKEQVGSRMYSIDDSTETWTEITPFSPDDGQTRTPQRYNAIGKSSSVIRAIVTDEGGDKYLVKTTDSGTTWEEEGETQFDWFRFLASSESAALGGDEFLQLTTDDFKTFHDRLGDWSRLGSVGFIEDFESLGLV
jgi:hypothetical protein